jgi:transcriptional regulator with XRE-family HTH domain
MDRPGDRLKRARERLKLTYRQVEAASQQIAARRGSDEFAIALSRLADIENKGTVPTVFRLYTLCAIYRLDFREALGWYGVPLDEMLSDALHVPLDETHAVGLTAGGAVAAPQPADLAIDLDKTTFLSHLIRRWGTLPLRLASGLDLRRYRYGFIGLSDWSMYPLLAPGSLVAIDEGRRKIASGGWTSEHDRPIYFVEHRGGYVCGWCALAGGRLLVQPHPSSAQQPRTFEVSEIDIIGQVIGVAMPLNAGTPHHPALPAPARSPDR